MAAISRGPVSDAGSIYEYSTTYASGASSPPSSVTSHDDLNHDDDPLPTQDLHLRQHKDVLACPFPFLDCHFSFDSDAFDDWYAHGISHFGGHQPPKCTICIFCNATHRDDDPWRSWKEQMHHIAGHFEDGSPIEHAQPDFALLLHLKAKSLITDEQYDKATQTRKGLLIDGLRSRYWIPEEQKRKEEAEQRGLARINHKPEKKQKYKGKDRAWSRTVVIVQPEIPSKQQDNLLEKSYEPLPLCDLDVVDEISKCTSLQSPSVVDSDASSDDGISHVDFLEKVNKRPRGYGFLPPGLDLDEDLMDPEGHAQRLEDIRDRAFRDSTASKIYYMPKAAKRESDGGRPLWDSYTECCAMLQRVCSNIRMLQDVGFCKGQLSFLKVDPQRINVALLIGIPVNNILRLGEGFEEQACTRQTVTIPTSRSMERQAVTNRLFRSQDYCPTEQAVWERHARSSSPLNHHDFYARQSSQDLTKHSKSLVSVLCNNRDNSEPSHTLFRIPDQANDPSPFQDPIPVPLDGQNLLEDWPMHGSLVIARDSAVVINHGKRFWDPDEPRSCDSREIIDHTNCYGFYPSSRRGNQRISTSGSQLGSGALFGKALDKEPPWNILAENCKALFKAAQISLEDQDTETTIYTVLRTLDLITLTYASAHVADLDDSPSRFGQKRDFFKIAGRKIYRGRRPCQPQMGAITLARRKLRCLNRFFSGQKVWVFHEATVDPRSNTRLLLSATPEDFADIWGPMWKIKDHEKPSGILRYDLENGSIISSEQSEDINGYDISLQANEQLCHWLSDSGLRKNELYVSTSNTLYISKPRLLVGTKKTVRLRTNKEQCHCTAAGVTKQLRNAGLLRPAGTSRDRKCIDAELVGGQLNGVVIPVSVNYAASIKTTAGRTFKESLIKRWTLERHKRNPFILLQYRAAEMSYCTENSRMIRLLDLLTTTTMSRLIDDLNPVSNIECKEAVKEALEVEPEKIIDLYLEHPEWRDEIGNLVICCLDTLVDTGTTRAMGDPLSVFWMYDHEEYILRYPSRRHRWSGFIKDGDESGTFVVLEEKCLIFKFGQGCRHPPKDARPFSEDTVTDESVFETAIFINDLLDPPAGLKLVKSEIREEPPHWNVKKVAPGSKFPMGSQGILEVIQALPKSTLLVKFIPNNPIKYGVKRFIKSVTDKESALHHFGLGMNNLKGDCPPITVFVVA